MTTPNPINELLAALDQDPEAEAALRQRILTQEILDLPQKVAQLTDTVGNLANTVAEMAEVFDQRLTALEERMDATNERLDATNGRLDATNERLDATNERLDGLASQQTRMQGQLDNLTGTDYERRVVRRAHRIVRRHLDVRNGRVLVAINRPDGDTITALLNEAPEQGLITEDDADELDRADIIMQGNSPDGADAYVVAEVSITIGDDDIDRAGNRARILQNASRVTTHATVIGTSISDANRERAWSNGVTVIILND